MHADQLDPRLNGELRLRMSQPWPHLLGTDEVPARRGDITPVHGHPGLHRTDEGVLDPGPVQPGSRLPGQDLGLAPVTAGHRHQRALGQYLCVSLVRAGCLRLAGRVPEERIAAIKVTAKDARDPLQERGGRRAAGRS